MHNLRKMKAARRDNEAAIAKMPRREK